VNKSIFLFLRFFFFILHRLANKERKRKRKEWKSQMREAGIKIPKVKTTKMALSTCKQRIVLDMSYDKMMSFKVNNRYIIVF